MGHVFARFAFDPEVNPEVVARFSSFFFSVSGRKEGISSVYWCPMCTTLQILFLTLPLWLSNTSCGSINSSPLPN
ncbi:hypothetical protein VNO77_03853 [Canavalia gladiata]|uniref:Uncharacterized protein n=1 Tax=Canavalia gladiata TaxID=3824 RepID=A0AAN9MVG6_CANGL